MDTVQNSTAGAVDIVESSMVEMQNYTNLFTNYVRDLQRRSGDKMLAEFAELRQFKMDTIAEQGIFYIEDATEMLIPKYLNHIESFGVISPTNRKPIFHNRWVIPIEDIDGNILNLVGYSNKADERYVYGTAKYYRRRETMWGLENLPLAYNLGYAILTEGITDAICLRNLGHKNTFAMCGTHNSDFIIKQLNRCRYGVIKVPDRDAAGARANKKWDCLRSITLNTYIKYKDIDEMCRESQEFREIVMEYLDICIDWIMQHEHRGIQSERQSITIT